MRFKFLPRTSFSLEKEDVTVLCLLAKGLGAKQISFVTGLSLSAVYRRMNRLRGLGFDGPGVYIPIEAVDGHIRVLARPLVVIGAGHCAYVPDDCDNDCLRCPYYSTHLSALVKVVGRNFLTPAHAAEYLVELAKRALRRGWELQGGDV